MPSVGDGKIALISDDPHTRKMDEKIELPCFSGIALTFGTAWPTRQAWFNISGLP
jgi:hypothetical protein